MFELTGKKALITGGGRGLGKAMATALAQAGADIAFTSREISSLAQTAETLRGFGGRVIELELDITDEESIKRCAGAAYSELGGIDILVNNAGCNIRKPSLEFTWEEWDTVLDTNLKGTFFMSLAAVPCMMEKGRGRIINIGSMTSFFGFSGIAPYCASRGGMVQLTKSLAAEWGPKGINVNCIAPGWFRTDQNGVLFEDEQWVAYALERIPKGRFGRSDDLAGITVFLASDASDYISGLTIPVCGGFSTGAMRATSFKQ